MKRLTERREVRGRRGGRGRQKMPSREVNEWTLGLKYSYEIQ